MSDRMRVRFEGRLTQREYELLVFDGKVDAGTVYFIKDTKRIYVGHEIYVDDNGSSTTSGMPVEYTTVLPDGTTRKRTYSEDGDEWRITFLEKKPTDLDFHPLHTFEFTCLDSVSEDGKPMNRGVIEIDNNPVFFSDAHAVFCEDLDQTILGTKEFKFDVKVPYPPKNPESATSKRYVDERDKELLDRINEEIDRATDTDDELRDDLDDEIARAKSEEERIERESKERDQAEKDRALAAEKSLDERKLDKDVFKKNGDYNTKVVQDIEVVKVDDKNLNVKTVIRDVELKSSVKRIYPVTSSDKTVTLKVEPRTDSKIGSLNVTVDQDALLNVVHKTYDEEIDGVKTFKGTLEVTGDTNFVTDLAKTSRSSSDGDDHVLPIRGVLRPQHGGSGKPYLVYHESNPILIVQEETIVDSPVKTHQEFAAYFDETSLAVYVTGFDSVVAKERARMTGVSQIGEPDTGFVLKNVTRAGDVVRLQFTLEKEKGPDLIKSSVRVAFEVVMDNELEMEAQYQTDLAKWEQDFLDAKQKYQDDYHEWMISGRVTDEPQEPIKPPPPVKGLVVSTTDKIETRVDCLYSEERKWNLGVKGGMKIQNAKDENEFYTVEQAEKRMQETGNLGQVMNAFAKVTYQGISDLAVVDGGVNYKTGDYVFVITGMPHDWAQYEQARAVVSAVTPAGKVTEVTLSGTQGFFHDNVNLGDLVTSTNGAGTGLKVKCTLVQRWGTRLPTPQPDPSKPDFTPPGSWMTVVNDETYNGRTQDWRLVDENEDGRLEWVPWVAHNQDRLLDGDFDRGATPGYVTIKHGNEYKDAVVKLTDRTEHRIEQALQKDDPDSVIQGNLTVQGDTTLNGPLTVNDEATFSGPTNLNGDTMIENAEIVDLHVTNDATFDGHVMVPYPVDPTDAANAQYVDDEIDDLYQKVTDEAIARETEIDDRLNQKIDDREVAIRDDMTLRDSESIDFTYRPNGPVPTAVVRIDPINVDGKNQPSLTITSGGLRIERRGVTEHNLDDPLYQWINRKVELKNPQDIRDEDVAFFGTDDLGHRVAQIMPPEEDPLTRDWIKRDDLVLKRLDQVIHGIKDFKDEPLIPAKDRDVETTRPPANLQSPATEAQVKCSVHSFFGETVYPPDNWPEDWPWPIDPYNPPTNWNPDWPWPLDFSDPNPPTNWPDNWPWPPDENSEKPENWPPVITYPPLDTSTPPAGWDPTWPWPPTGLPPNGWDPKWPWPLDPGYVPPGWPDGGSGYPNGGDNENTNTDGSWKYPLDETKDPPIGWKPEWPWPPTTPYPPTDWPAGWPWPPTGPTAPPSGWDPTWPWPLDPTDPSVPSGWDPTWPWPPTGPRPPTYPTDWPWPPTSGGTPPDGWDPSWPYPLDPTDVNPPSGWDPSWPWPPTGPRPPTYPTDWPWPPIDTREPYPDGTKPGDGNTGVNGEWKYPLDPDGPPPHGWPEDWPWPPTGPRPPTYPTDWPWPPIEKVLKMVRSISTVQENGAGDITGVKTIYETYIQSKDETTYPSKKMWSDDIVLRVNGNDTHLSGEHFVNRDQDKDETINGLKTFIGGKNMGPDNNAVFIPVKDTDVFTVPDSKAEVQIATEAQVKRLLPDALLENNGTDSQVVQSERYTQSSSQDMTTNYGIGSFDAVDVSVKTRDMLARTNKVTDTTLMQSDDVIIKLNNVGGKDVVSVSGGNLVNKTQYKDESITGFKKFLGGTGMPVIGGNAIGVPEKTTDVYQVPEAKRMYNVATEAQVKRLLSDALLNDMSGATMPDTSTEVVQSVTFSQNDNQVLGTNNGLGSYDKVNLVLKTRDLEGRVNGTSEITLMMSDDIGIDVSIDNGKPVVTLTGKHLVNKDQYKDEEINGTKTFSSHPVVPNKANSLISANDGDESYSVDGSQDEYMTEAQFKSSMEKFLQWFKGYFTGPVSTILRGTMAPGMILVLDSNGKVKDSVIPEGGGIFIPTSEPSLPEPTGYVKHWINTP